MADQLFWNHPSSDNVLTILLSNNSNPNVENEEGDSPLNIALAEDASVTEVQCLIRAGADPHHRGKDGLNAYQQAISKGNNIVHVCVGGGGRLSKSPEQSKYALTSNIKISFSNIVLPVPNPMCYHTKHIYTCEYIEYILKEVFILF